jgi:hypothetical protein
LPSSFTDTPSDASKWYSASAATWGDADGKLLRTRGLDADQTEAAIKATFKMLNIIENEQIEEI